MSGVRGILAFGGTVAVIGAGIALWFGMHPGDERQKEMLKNLPEANPTRMEEVRRRNVLALQVLKEAAETQDNVARGFFPSKSK
ncbi:ubiquinol-cytochrome-c reductase complex assembly factor 3 [Arapaima gigas]